MWKYIAICYNKYMKFRQRVNTYCHFKIMCEEVRDILTRELRKPFNCDLDTHKYSSHIFDVVMLVFKEYYTVACTVNKKLHRFEVEIKWHYCSDVIFVPYKQIYFIVFITHIL